MACTMASTPVAAVTWLGRPTVSCASKIAKSGSRRLETMPVFCVAPVVTIEIGVTSEPVPAVVGTWINGSLSPTTRSMP